MKYSYKELPDGSIAVDIGKLIVDEEDVEVARNVYISIQIPRDNNRGTINLARKIMNCPKGMVVDHINVNSLDNRKANLRICTTKENNQNKRKKNSVSHTFIKENDESYSYDPGPLLIDKENLYLLEHIYISVKKTLKCHSSSLANFIMNRPKGMIVDHIDGDSLNNRKSNLRICTSQQNCYNISARKGTSNYRGIYFDKKANKWAASININRKNTYLGVFEDEKTAAKMYDVCANYLYGEFARLNFPNEDLLNIPPEEILNKTKNKNYSSKYKGVSWDKNSKKWKVCTRIGEKNNERKYLGLFIDEYEAHLVYENYVNKIKAESIIDSANISH